MNTKKFWKIIIGTLILMMIPLLVIAKYDQPSADDYMYGAATNQVWQSSHSLLMVLATAWNTMVDKWWSWDGNFTSTFLGALQPHIFGLYGMVAAMIILSLVLCLIILSWEIIVHYLGGPRHVAIVVALLLSLLMTQFMPSPVQGMYWFDGAISYTFIYSLCLLDLALILKAYRSHGLEKGILTFSALLLGFFCGGANFALAVTFLLLLATATFVLWRWPASHFQEVLLVFLSSLGGFLLAAVAPGNSVRQADVAKTLIQQDTVFSAIAKSLGAGGSYLIGFWSLPVLICSGLIALALVPLIRQKNWACPHPLCLTGLGFSLYCAGYSPVIYGLGLSSLHWEGRVLDIQFFNAVFLAAGLLTYWGGYAVHRLARSKKPRSFSLALPHKKKAAVLLGGFAIIVTLMAHPNAASLSAAQSLLDGSARAYAWESEDRMALYTNKTLSEVSVSKLTVKPHLLYYDDIKENQWDWRNIATAQYYGKRSVRLQ